MLPPARSPVCFLPALGPAPAGGGGGDADLWVSGAPGYLLSCHISLLSKLRESGRPGGASVLNDSGHLSLTRSPQLLRLSVIYRRRGGDPGGGRPGPLSRASQEVRRGSSEQRTNFQFKKVCLCPSRLIDAGESQP